MNNNVPLWKKWLKNPWEVGTIRPSSPGLVNLMTGQVPENAQVLVEFGAGTGPITEVLPQRFPQAQIFSFELDKELVQKVQAKVPGVRLFNCNVIEAPAILPQELVGQVDVVLSSLPLLSIPKNINRQILESAFRILKPQGSFVQFTYLPFMPPVRLYKELGLWSQFVGVEIKNLPPAYVWSFRKI